MAERATRTSDMRFTPLVNQQQEQQEQRHNTHTHTHTPPPLFPSRWCASCSAPRTSARSGPPPLRPPPSPRRLRPAQASETTVPSAGVSASFEFGVNTDSSFTSTTAPVILSEMDLSSGTTNQSMYVYEMTSLQISKTETWEDANQWLTITYAITNTSASDVTNFVVMHGLDPDQDYDLFADFTTLNDTRDDGLVATSTGPVSGVSIAYGVCDALG